MIAEAKTAEDFEKLLAVLFYVFPEWVMNEQMNHPPSSAAVKARIHITSFMLMLLLFGCISLDWRDSARRKMFASGVSHTSGSLIRTVIGHNDFAYDWRGYEEYL